MLQKLLRTTFSTAIQLETISTIVVKTTPGFLDENPKTLKNSTNSEFTSDSKERSNLLLNHFTAYNVKKNKTEGTKPTTSEMPEYLFFLKETNNQCVNENVSNGRKVEPGIRKSRFNSNVTTSAQC